VARPDWLFLDESTSAVDERQADLYRRLAAQLPDATIVSMGHRSTLHPLHDRHMEMTLTDAGLFSPRERQPACHGIVATGKQDAEDCRLTRVAT
jgi:putative ATP-binding cassette transporter